ncbi:YitT family protein [Salibacterium salarium]|uniref:YitT family protein n=1 Tax=Salibacterium salarium TaxID=284579 RepID=A0A428N004_9BACI|nr:YitT family protein [Salibacterium salarium]RSL31730.1 YitT family protein [Salibacterium salarium]
MMNWFQGIRLTNIAIICFGAVIFAFGIIHFNLQNGLAHGGFTGLSLIIYYLLSIEPSVSNLLLNVPLFIIGYKLLGRRVFIYSLFGTIMVSVALHIFENYWHAEVLLQNDMILVSLFAGVFAGTGLGIIFRAGGTTGGSDIIARLAEKYLGMGIGTSMFLFDAFVITFSLVHLSLPQAMYTLVAVFVAARVIDFIIEGANAAKSAMIISNHTSSISDAIIKRMGRGSTVLTGKGSFTKDERNVLYCVVNRNQLIHLKTIISEVDPYAFVSVHDVKEVAGEGFTFDPEKHSPQE